MQGKRRLYIIGASHLGREVGCFFDLCPPLKEDYEIQGFLHSYTNISPLEGYPSDYKVLGGWEDYELSMNDYCIIAVAETVWRERVFKRLQNKTNLFTFIHPTAIILKHTIIGTGCVISARCLISTNVQLGRGVFINAGTQLGHDIKVGDFSSIMSQVEIGGGGKIGKRVFIGSNVTILPNLEVEDDCIIGAGSVVVKRVKSGTTVFGNPAKEL